jgi:peptidoglycan-associated lipoprotein
MLAAAGCARQGMVKKEEIVPPAAAVKQAEEKQAAEEAAVKKQVVGEQAVKGEKGPSGEQAQANQQPTAFESIYFDFDSYALSATARSTLTRTFDMLKRRPGTAVRIEGNCDERGADEYNLALGDKRAQSAKAYLTTMGIAAGRLSTISYGKEKPLNDGHDEIAWAKNRRDDFILPK